jgi:hypothetical protein
MHRTLHGQTPQQILKPFYRFGGDSGKTPPVEDVARDDAGKKIATAACASISAPFTIYDFVLCAIQNSFTAIR